MKSLFEVLELAISSGHGFIEAEEIYAETFRSPESFSAADAPEFKAEMIEFLTSDVFPPQEGDYCDWYDPDPIIKGMSNAEAESLVSGGIRFVDTCNYKGEGCGIIPELMSSGMRVFVNKYNYI